MLTGKKFASIENHANPLAEGKTASRIRSARSERRGTAGFTMLELMVVIGIILILLGMAVGRYQRSLLHAREAVLKHDLQVMREAIQNYTMDKEAPPASIEDLVDKHYLPSVPTDPITQDAHWDTVPDDGILLTPEQTTTTGIMDVHSKSHEISPFENTPYNTW